MSMTALESLCYNTIRLEVETPDGLATGTGFLYEFVYHDNLTIPVVVTNKHVIEGGEVGRFAITLRTEQGEPADEFTWIELDEFEERWIKHPDSDVDLAVMGFQHIEGIAAGQDKRLFHTNVDRSIVMRSEGFNDLIPGLDVLMVGYPNGLWDRKNNSPIFRKGIAATNPATKYEGKDQFLIDAAVFPGSSGSPVFLFETIDQVRPRRRGPWDTGKYQVKLLGVLYAVHLHETEGDIQFVPVPTTEKAVVISRMPNNLGLVIRATRLDDFLPLITKEMTSSKSIS